MIRATPLRDAADTASFGGKASGLARLLAWGFHVPDGVALDWESVAAIGAGAEAPEVPLPGPWAVRSSAVDEDGGANSFAGQHATKLGVQAEGLRDAILAVLASGSGAGAQAYRASFGLDAQAKMAVVIQRMVASERAYVAFGVDPVSGDDVVVIEGVRGLGEPLVSGEVTPDHYRVGRDGRILLHRPGDEPCGASEAEIAEIAALVCAVGERAGGPQDLELATFEGRVHLLQARPISVVAGRPPAKAEAPVPPKPEPARPGGVAGLFARWFGKS